MVKPPPDLFGLIKIYLPDWAPSLVFDVGANVGQTVADVVRRFPECKVHAFEPSPASFRQLALATSGFPNVTAHACALGRHPATLGMIENGTSTMNRLLPANSQTNDSTPMVKVRTGADVVRELDAPRIDLLKIDTEGHDYEVLVGFLPVIQQVDFIQVEAAMNPYNKTHRPLRLFEDLLWHEGFYLFHMFEQTMEWKRGGRPVLRRCNPVFINGRHLNLDKIA